ncbi:16S rRNA (guanine(527)-N(7))-methyltransferase RsmG [Pseudalkalibacillus berkeleyi]|uniref:Ribosomal RNA small subunit methyltransferase G n=1 Tax=Pseudalkalibacillus berkeleyi TaxID=1069813 RepID=A0ABS9H2D1_9BACL|nr:16S rRNA (guanine(527)-N(7))-methyltransferase RsmG [Pseudalkalibacillus berkeleyi]MCF6139114.1 16S rRNA (guanine(527)-N(7))-methyltransferase RsmG [Pseudalkalibacillus berkeleyi]
MNIEQFQHMLEEKGINLSPDQLHQFDTYYKTLVEWNEKMNLTAITDREGVYLKHFYDSITAAFHFDFTKVTKVCDVGAGAGFPSIPLKICFPHLDVTIVDSLNKRITFLEHLSKQLNLTNTHFYHDRAETFAKNKSHREGYDLVTARAVARLSVLTELCLPLVRENGTFLAMKAANASDELEDAKNAIHLLGGRFEQLEQLHLPIEESERNLIFVRKQKSTPKKYPRKPGTPNKAPL